MLVEFIKNPENVKIIVIGYSLFLIILMVGYGIKKSGIGFFKNFF